MDKHQNKRMIPAENRRTGSGQVRFVGGIVLCGGDSRRMGRDKAWLPFGGQTLLSRLVRITSQVVSPVVVAARPGQELPPLPSGVSIVRDAVSGKGPLAGMAAGFEALSGLSHRCEAAFVTSCDHPLLRPAVIDYLIASLEDCGAVVPACGNRWYALTAVYRLEHASILQDMLASEETAARCFAKRCGARLISVEAFRHVDPRLDFLTNVNDAESYDRARKIEDGRDHQENR